MINVGDLLAVLSLKDELTPALTQAIVSLDSFESHTNSTGFQLTLLGRGFREAGVLSTAFFTVPILGAAKAVIEFGSNFETEMTKVFTLAGLTREQLAEIRQPLLQMAGDVAIGPGELAKGLYVITSTGRSSAESMDLLKTSAEMAALGMGKTNETALALTGALFSYRNQNLTAAEAANVLIKAVKYGNMEIQDLVPSIARVNPVASAMGIKFQDVAASIATFTHAGVSSSVAANGLRAMLSNILNDSAKTEKGFKELARAANDNTISMANFRNEINTGGLTQAMLTLMSSVEKAGEAGVNSMNKIFPNIRALVNALAVFKLNGGQVTDIMEKMTDGFDDLGEGTKELHKTWAFQWNQMKIEVEKIWISLGDAGLMKIFKDMLGFAKNYLIPAVEVLVKIFAALPEPLQIAAVMMAGLVAAGGPLLIFFGQLFMSVGNISRGLTTLGSMVTTLGNTVPVLTARVWLLDVAQTAAGASAIRWATALGTLGLAAGAGYLIAKASNELSKDFTHTQETLNDVIDQHQHRINKDTIAEYAATKALEEKTQEIINNTKALQNWQATSQKGTSFGKDTNLPIEIPDTSRAKIINYDLIESVKRLTDAERDKIDILKEDHLTIAQIASATGIATDVVGLYVRQVKAETTETKAVNKELEKYVEFRQKQAGALERVMGVLEEMGAPLVMANDEFAKMAISGGAALTDVATVTEIPIQQLRLFKKEITESKQSFDKFAADIQTSQSRIEALTADTAVRTAKAEGDSYEARQAAVDAFVINSVAALNKLHLIGIQGELQYWNNIKAILDNAAAQRSQNEKKQIDDHNAALAVVKTYDERHAADLEALQQELNGILAKGVDNQVAYEIAKANEKVAKLKEANQKQLAEEIRRLNALRVAGALSQAEFNAAFNAAVATANDKSKVIERILTGSLTAVRHSFSESFNMTASALSNFASTANNKVVTSISHIASTTLTAYTAGKQLRESIDAGTASWGDYAAATLQAAGAMVEATAQGSRTERVLGGMAAGFAYGNSLMPGWGGLIGAGAGALIGFARSGDVVKESIEGFTAKFGNIDDMRARMSRLGAEGKRLMAQLNMSQDLNQSSFAMDRLDKKLAETERIVSRIVTSDMLPIFMDNLEGIFNEIALGGERSVESLSDLEEQLKKIGDYFAKNGGLWSGQFAKDVQRGLAEGSEAAADLIAGQTSRATTGLSTFLGVGSKAYADLAEAQTKLADLQGRYADASSEEQGKLQTEIDATTKTIADQQKIIANVGITSQQSATAFGTSVFGMFSQFLSNGMSLTEALEKVKPAVNDLQGQLDKAGFAGGAAFGQLNDLIKITSDSVAGPTISAINGLGDALSGMQNLGMLNQETFAGLASQITTTFTSLIGQGFNGNTALQAMQPTLQTIWQLQHDFGYEVDEATQALITQAEEQGLVGATHQSVADQMLEMTRRMTEATEGLARVFGVTLPNDMDKSGKAGKDAAQTIRNEIAKIPTTISIDFDVANINMPSIPGEDTTAPPVYPQAQGGDYLVTRPTLFLAGEAGPERATFSGANNTGGSGGSGTIVVQLVADGRQLAEVVVPNVPGVLDRYGLRR